MPSARRVARCLKGTGRGPRQGARPRTTEGGSIPPREPASKPNQSRPRGGFCTKRGRRDLKPRPARKKGTGAPWGPVHGELLTFDDPKSRLPAIDRLEGFHALSACDAQAAGGPCLHRRLLVSVQAHGTVPSAWLFVVEARSNPTFKPLPSGNWRS